MTYPSLLFWESNKRNEFKSTYKIMDELAAKWKDLSDIQQATVTELIAGKRQGNIVSSLMTNFDTARDALETSLNSSGSAMREHEKWQQSLEAQINKLKASWQGLSQAFMKSDFLHGALGAVIKLIDGITLLIDKVGVIPTLLAGFTAFKSLSGNKGIFRTFDNDLDGFANKIGLANKSFTELINSFKSANTGGLKGFISGLKSMGDALANPLSKADLSAIDSYNKLIDDGIDGQVAFAQTMKGTSNAAQSLVQSANGGKVALTGMKTASIGVKAGLIGAKVAAVAFNAALTMGISLLIDFAISGIMKLVNAKKELAEKVDEVTSKFREQHTELVKNKSSFESQAKRYGELVKGVDDLGNNVSLTTDEYVEYQDIVNSIADQIPALVSGYDSQGNAILSCRGSVEQLTAAYEELIKKQNEVVLKDNYKKIIKDFRNKMNDFDGENEGFKNEIAIDTVKLLENALNGKYSRKEVEKAFNLASDTVGAVDLLKEVGLAEDIHWYSSTGAYIDAITDAIENSPDKVREAIDSYRSDVDATAEGMRSVAQAALSKAFDFSDSEYKDIGTKTQSLIRQIVNNFDAEQFDKIIDSGQTVEEYINNMIDSFKNMSDGESSTLEAVFDLKTKFNGGDISYGEYVENIREAEGLIDSLALDDEVKNQIKLTLDTEGITDEYDALINRLTSKEIGLKSDEAKKFLDELSAEEFSVATDIIPKLDANATIKDIQAAIDREMAVQGLVFNLNLEVETTSIESLNEALAESVSATGLSSESINALKARYAGLEKDGYNLSAMFEETSNGIHLNKKAFNELEQAYAMSKGLQMASELGRLEDEYINLTKEIENCNDASERASLYIQRDAIIQQINDAATLAAQYEGLTSAYNKWQSAEETGQERDMYENILKGLEGIDDEISRGWLDDGTIEFLELLTGETNLAALSAKELKEVYKELDKNIKDTSYSVRDFFTVDEDGNSTSRGVYNFLDAIGQLEEEKFGGKDVIKRDENGKIVEFDFKLAGGQQAVADALNVSEELVQIMLRAADDAGFVVNLEGAYTQLADLKTEAEAARDTLISLKKDGLEELGGVDVNFDLDAEGDDLIKEQKEALNLLEKFKKDGKIDLTMPGAQQALDIAEYLTIKLDDLTEPKIMQIDVSEVDEDLRDPIEKMQEIVKLSKEKNLVTLTGDTEELKEVQGEISKVAEELEGLDPEIKAKVGIDENWDAETIASKVEKGEVEIPAELELDVQMSDDLKDMRLMMMNQLGLASDEEVKLKVGFDIDESLVDTLDDKQQKVVVEYITKNKAEFDKLTEEKEVVVKLIADGVDLDKYKPEDKEAIVNYIANGEEADGWTPEAKDAFVKYLADGGEIDKFDPKNKDSWVVYNTDTTKPDSYDPKDPDATVTYKKDTKDIDNYNPPSFTRFIKFIASLILPQSVKNALAKIGITLADGTANADGTAFIDGTALANGTTGRAFKRGDWRTKKTETALTGELGRRYCDHT